MHDFKSFEKKGWETPGIVHAYHDYFGSITSQAIRPLLKLLNIKKGMKVLDIATGPGYGARLVAKQGTDVIGIDFSKEMIRIAQRNNPHIAFLQADAENLPFKDNSFDMVIMNFGLLHFAQPERALREIYRALKPKGKVGYTVWSTQNETIGFDIMLHAVKNYKISLPPAPPFFRFSDPNDSKKVLEETGFIYPHFVKVPQIWKVKNVNEFFNAFYKGAVRMGAVLRTQDAKSLIAIKRIIQKALGIYKRNSHFEIPMPALITIAEKPYYGANNIIT